MKSTSWIEISKSALKQNYAFIKELTGPETLFSSVLKGNAYGHGIAVFGSLAYEIGQRHFSVFSAEEAYELYQALEKTDITILIMGSVNQDQMDWVIEQGLEFFLFNDSRLDLAIQRAKKLGIKAKIHIEVETGMNRTGFGLRTLTKLREKIESNSQHLDIKGVCTHLAGAESIANYKRIQDQVKRFKRVKSNTASWTDSPIQEHALCSAGLMRYPRLKLDMVRVGIIQYGYFPTQEMAVYYYTRTKTFENPLKQVLSWKTRIMDINQIPPGEFVGYGTSFFTNTSTRIAIIPIGYSDGFARSLSNNGKVIIRGIRLNVVGMVNMNMIAVDINDQPAAEVGDEVILIGKEGDAEISVSSFSETSQQVNYELLTRLPQDIDRILID